MVVVILSFKSPGGGRTLRRNEFLYLLDQAKFYITQMDVQYQKL